MQKQAIFSILTFTGLAFFQPVAATAISSGDEPLGEVKGVSSEFLEYTSDPVTISLFAEETEKVTERLPFETEYQDDPEMEWGKEETIQEGKDGKRTKTYEVTFWDGEEVARELIATETEPPQKKIIKRGTKITWRKVPGKGYKYWAKLRVWATSYDGKCPGCRGLTYSGTPVKHGVCAVDPKLIPLGTNFYVPGYGICRAEDIGGAIRGKMVDLGFEDISQGFWSAQDTDIYLLTNAPE